MDVNKCILVYIMKDFSSVEEILAYLDFQEYKLQFRNCTIYEFFNLNDLDLMRLGIQIRIHRVKILDFIASHIPSQIIASDTETDISELNSQQTPEILDLSYQSSRCFCFKAVSGYLDGLVFKIGESGAVIGRSSSSEITIPDGFVSRKHCKIEYNKSHNQFTLTDTGSTTGTYVMVSSQQILSIGMQFQAGQSEFKVLNIVYSLDGTPSFIELVQYEGLQAMPIIITQGGCIGRNRSCEISVPVDELMSAEHCLIFKKETFFYLKDLGSRNKTWIRLSPEGEFSDEYLLREGDFIKIGFIIFYVQQGFSSKKIPECKACQLCDLREFDSYLMPCSHRACIECASEAKNCRNCGNNIEDIVLLDSIRQISNKASECK